MLIFAPVFGGVAFDLGFTDHPDGAAWPVGVLWPLWTALEAVAAVI